MEHPSIPPPEEKALSAVEAAELRYLEGSDLHFFRFGSALRLILGEECCYLKVNVVRAFPLSHPLRYLSLRDGDNKEIGLLLKTDDLPDDGARLVEEELERRYLAPVIRRVTALKERFGTVDWEVDTDRGPRSFTTRNLRDSVVRPSPGRYILSDVDGNRYDVEDLPALDAASQSWLVRHV